MKLKTYIQATLRSNIDAYRGIDISLREDREWQKIIEFYNRAVAPYVGYPGRIRVSDLDEDIYAFRSDMYEVWGRNASDFMTEREKEERDDINYCDACDQYYYDSAFDSNADRCIGCAEEEERESDDDDTDDYGVPDYHSQDKSWRPDPKAPLYGIELETLVKDTSHVTSVYNKIVSHGFLGERDGSLDSRRGIEIVGKPMTFEENRTQWTGLLNALRGKVVGWMAGTGYGMHISVNRQSMSRLHQGKFLVFIHKNKSLCEKVAGRKEVHWCSYHSGKKVVDARHEFDDKYQAVSLRSRHRMEVRIFRSTLAPEGFMRNLEFVAAAIAFTRGTGIGCLTEESFREWLKVGGRRKEYPNLFAKLNPKPRVVEQATETTYQPTPTTE